MIDFLRGSVVGVDEESIVLDVGGVGYRVYCPAPYRFRPSEAPILVYTHLHVREDEWVLYGFAQLPERTLFRQLLTVSGIGPKLALSMLGAASCEEIAAAIAGEDVTLLTRLPGVGKKTAQRLIVELKDKVEVPLVPAAAAADGPAAVIPQGGVWREVADALLALGYKEAEIRTILRELSQQQAEEREISLDQALRCALQRIDTLQRAR